MNITAHILYILNYQEQIKTFFFDCGVAALLVCITVQ
jgi:hypothetical protein